MRTLKNILLGTSICLLSSVVVCAQGWSSAGPSNIAGRILAVQVDVNNGEKIYAGAAGGGFWTSTNGGLSWGRNTSLNGSSAVSAIAQSSDGTLYVGTGEGLNLGSADPGVLTNNYPYGIKGDGVYKSKLTNNGLEFERLPGTENWTDVNAIAYDNVNGKLYVATNEGLKISSNGGTSFVDAPIPQWIRGVSLKVGKDGTVVYAEYSGGGNVFVSTDGGSSFTSVGGALPKLPINGKGRIAVDIAPSNPNMIYAVLTSSTDGTFAGVYLSENKGQIWREIFPPGAPTVDPISGWGYYCNAVAISPLDSSKILVGGLYLYRGTGWGSNGNYDWNRINGAPPFIHCIYFANDNKAYVGTNTGLNIVNMTTYAVSQNNNNLISLQAYTLGVSNESRLMVGTRDNRTILIANPGVPVKTGRELPIKYPDKTVASNGADCIFSMIKPDALFYTAAYGYCCRQASLTSEPQLPSQWIGGSSIDAGLSTQGSYFYQNILNKLGDDKKDENKYTRWQYSNGGTVPNMSGMSSPYANNYVSPLAIWESVNDENTIDSVVFTADRTYAPGDEICVKSKRNGYPMWMKYTGTDTLRRENGDTWKVKDVVTSRLFIGGSGYKANGVAVAGAPVFMTTEALDFVNSCKFSCVFRTADTLEQVMKILPTKDGNHLFILVRKYAGPGISYYSIYRVSGFDTYRAYEEMDVSGRILSATVGLSDNNPNRMLEDNILVENIPDILDIALDPSNANNLIYTTNIDGMRVNVITDALIATGGTASVGSREGNLPSKLPVYCAIVEMSNSDIAYIGTEEGVFKTENFTSSNPQWDLYNNGINAKVPVFKLHQQTNYIGNNRAVYYDAQGKETSVRFQGVTNYGVLYAATHGLGIFMDSAHWDKILDPYFPPMGGKSVNLTVFPNPAANSITLDFTLSATNNVLINITDITGKTVYTQSLGMRMIGNYQENIDCSVLSEGLYFVTVNAGSQNQSAKVVIRK